MNERPWDDERDPNDAPLGMDSDQAYGWACGYNAAIEEYTKQLNKALAQEKA